MGEGVRNRYCMRSPYAPIVAVTVSLHGPVSPHVLPQRSMWWACLSSSRNRPPNDTDNHSKRPRACPAPPGVSTGVPGVTRTIQTRPPTNRGRLRTVRWRLRTVGRQPGWCIPHFAVFVPLVRRGWLNPPMPVDGHFRFGGNRPGVDAGLAAAQGSLLFLTARVTPVYGRPVGRNGRRPASGPDKPRSAASDPT